eukprot:scaffold5392_cov107-Cylindrotheca_fusiformis.AAC.8
MDSIKKDVVETAFRKGMDAALFATIVTVVKEGGTLIETAWTYRKKRQRQKSVKRGRNSSCRFIESLKWSEQAAY